MCEVTEFPSPQWGSNSKVDSTFAQQPDSILVSVPAMGIQQENIFSLIIGTEMPISQ